ncbi:MAG: sigma-70 family RNA polymerase sigma factor [Pirellulaceae bacterium]|nr:sigma-70 family RNA polymerase sigma factor [Pirellulaceae bacterium]MDP7018189.1 sigma-70 family RNA polymerase sigma factor [Pirellulaceae bacterium]
MDDSTVLVERVQAGDVDSFSEYMSVVQRPLLAFTHRRMSDSLRARIEAEDVVQEALAEAVRTFGDVDLREREPFHWLCQLCERRTVDAHRRYFAAQKRSASRETSLESHSDDSGGWSDLLAASITTPSAVFSRNAREAKLADSLASLPDDQQEGLRLRYVENLPTKQIAERLGKTDAAVRVMLTRSLKKLQKMLSRDGGRTFGDLNSG